MRFLERLRKKPNADSWVHPLRHGQCKRWMKILLRVDPLIGMFIVNYPVIGIILDRIETGSEPRYLAHFFNSTGDEKIFENHFLMCLPLTGDARAHWDLFYSLEEAQRWWNWISQAKQEGQQRREQQRPFGLPN